MATNGETTIDAATRAAQQAASGGSPELLLERLAELIGGRAGVQAVFGQPIEHGDTTVVPVARVRWGVGGGAGSATGSPAGPGSGSGGGGGVAADPIGYLEIGPSGASFRPIAGPFPSPVFLVASALAAAIVIRALARLLRG